MYVCYNTKVIIRLCYKTKVMNSMYVTNIILSMYGGYQTASTLIKPIETNIITKGSQNDF